MEKTAIIGAFDFDTLDHGGQPVKSRQLYHELCKIKGEENVMLVEMYRRKRYKVLFDCILKFFACEEIIMLPAHNGLLVLTPLLSFLNRIKKRKLHYVVIGGWLPSYLDSHKKIKELLQKNFYGIYPETSFMEEELKERGFKNTFVFPNYKDIKAVSKEEMCEVFQSPIKVCFFSRVTEKKGVEDAIRAVNKINEEAGEKLIEFDIYGAVDESFKEKFEALLKLSDESIAYKGIASPEDTVSFLKPYALQLFPTRFKTEGIPGSVIESFFAGVPVVSSRWNSFSDVIKDEITGIGYEFGNYEDLVEKLRDISKNYEKINQMKKNCIDEAEKYKAECKKKIRQYF